jgi:hypothetical protein
LGLVPTLVVIGFVAFAAKKLGLLAVLVSAGAMAYGLMGLAGYAAVVGERLWPDAQAWRQSRNGGLVIICVALFPVVGWFFIFPLMMVVGLGVNVRAWRATSEIAA